MFKLYFGLLCNDLPKLDWNQWDLSSNLADWRADSNEKRQRYVPYSIDKKILLSLLNNLEFLTKMSA